MNYQSNHKTSVISRSSLRHISPRKGKNCGEKKLCLICIIVSMMLLVSLVCPPQVRARAVRSEKEEGSRANFSHFLRPCEHEFEFDERSSDFKFGRQVRFSSAWTLEVCFKSSSGCRLKGKRGSLRNWVLCNNLELMSWMCYERNLQSLQDRIQRPRPATSFVIGCTIAVLSFLLALRVPKSAVHLYDIYYKANSILSLFLY